MSIASVAEARQVPGGGRKDGNKKSDTNQGGKSQTQGTSQSQGASQSQSTSQGDGSAKPKTYKLTSGGDDKPGDDDDDDKKWPPARLPEDDPKPSASMSDGYIPPGVHFYEMPSPDEFVSSLYL